MGHGSGGGYSASTGSLSANIKELSSKYPLSPSGRFGVPGKSAIARRMYVDNPEKTARDFFEKLSRGGNPGKTKSGDVMKTFPDGSRVVFRPSSHSDGSPTIDINHKGPGNRPYKVHFVERQG